MFKKEMITSDASAELVSIIIVAHNKKKLPTCLNFIYKQDYPNIELILVDKGGFIAENRNYGFDWCTGKYILFLDDDECLSSKAISACVKKFHLGYDLASLEVIEVVKSGYTPQAIAMTRKHGPKSMFFRKSVLDALNCLFKIEYVYCDDVEIQLRILSRGYKLGKVSENEAYMIHFPTLTFRGYMRKILFGRKPYGGMVRLGQINPPVKGRRKRIIGACMRRPIFAPFVLFFVMVCSLVRRIP